MKDNIKEGYKDSALGEIPDSWEVVKLGDVIEGKGAYGINAAAVDYDVDLPTYLRITDIDERGKFISNKMKSVDANNSDNFYLEQGDIVFARTGNTTGKSYLYNEADGRLVYAGFLIKFSIKAIYSSVFLSHYVNTNPYWNWVKVMSSRSGQPGINEKQYSDLDIPSPPLKEQKKIAEILSTVDKKIDIVEQQIKETKELKKGLIQKLLVKGIGHTKFKDSPLGQIPHSWEVVELGKISIKIGDGIHSTPKYVNESDYYFINGNNLVKGHIVITDKTNCVSREEYVNNITDLKLNTILMSINGTIGNLAYYKGENVVLGKSAAYILPIKDILNNSFLYYLLQIYIIKEFYKKELTGTTIRNLSLKTIRKTPVLLPPLKEQKQIAGILTTVDDKIDILEKKKSDINDLKKGLMQQLLTGKIRVNIN